MGSLGPVEWIVLPLSLMLYAVGIAGMVLGVLAFFKVRRLEKRVSELQTRIL